jgi:fatty-acyl-CoA synthase
MGVLGEVVKGAPVLKRAGLVRAYLPRPKLLALAAKAPFRTPNLGTAVALHAALRPSEPAVVDATGQLTWAELDDRVTRLANALLDLAQDGQRVAFMVRNGRAAIECYAAAARAGLAAVPVNTWSSRGELRHIVETQDPAVFIADEEFADDVEAERQDAEVLITGADGRYEQALAGASSSPPSVKGGGRVVTHTSGTTGKPKGAERDLGGGSISALVAFLEKVPLHADEEFLLTAPLFHTFAQGMMGIGLVLGMTLVLPPRFDPAGFLDTMAERRIAAAALVPAMLRKLLEVEDAPDTPEWRFAVLSGSALPPALREQAEERFGNIFYDLYGSTEVGWATIATPQDHVERPGSVGRPGKGMKAFAVDDDGTVLPPGEIGRIHVATGFEFEGYTGIDSDRQTAHGGTEFGDLGYVDDDGYLYVTGRADDMIVSGGENVYPSEVEAVLDEHPDIADAAVVGADDEEYGEVLHAFVVPRQGASVSSDDVVSFVRERLSRYKAPKRVKILDELPRNATGKVLKGELPDL